MKNTLRSLFSLVPENAVTFLRKHVFTNRPEVRLMITKCPDSTVRKAVVELLLHAVNVIIEHHNFQLDLKVLAERTEEEVLKNEEFILEGQIA